MFKQNKFYFFSIFGILFFSFCLFFLFNDLKISASSVCSSAIFEVDSIPADKTKDYVISYDSIRNHYLITYGSAVVFNSSYFLFDNYNYIDYDPVTDVSLSFTYVPGTSSDFRKTMPVVFSTFNILDDEGNVYFYSSDISSSNPHVLYKFISAFTIFNDFFRILKPFLPIVIDFFVGILAFRKALQFLLFQIRGV